MDEQNPTEQTQAKGTSGLAVAALVLGILALLASFVPIINNGAFIIAIIGLILAIVGRSQVKKGGKSGGGMAVAGIVLNIVAIVITLMVQAACSAALDSINTTSGSVASSSAAATSGAGGEAAEQVDTANMAVGQTVDVDGGLSITVNSITPGLVNYDGSAVTGVSVTYVNNGSSNASFNVYDWKAEDANGAQRSETYYSDAVDALSSGTLSAGGTVTGNIYFDEPIAKVYYYSSILSSNSDIAWVVA